MRKQDLGKKLTLNKQTISRLDVDAMLHIRGGLTFTQGDNCDSSEQSNNTRCSCQHVKTKDHILCPPDDTGPGYSEMPVGV